MNNTDLIDEFSDSLWLEDGLSRNTLESYRRDLNKFAAWLERQGRATLLEMAREVEVALAFSPPTRCARKP